MKSTFVYVDLLQTAIRMLSKIYMVVHPLIIKISRDKNETWTKKMWKNVRKSKRMMSFLVSVLIQAHIEGMLRCELAKQFIFFDSTGIIQYNKPNQTKL